MSVREDLSGIEPEGPPAADSAGGRVWQACLACRRKKVMKIKCDGKQPCHNCSSRDQSCEFPGTKDNASASRYYVTSFEARCQQMDTLCQRLEVLTGQLSQSIGALSQQSPALANHNQPSDSVSAAEIIKSLPELAALLSQATASPRQESRAIANPNSYASVAELDVNTGVIDAESDTSSSNNKDDNDDFTPGVCTFSLTKSAAENLGQAGALVRDSYGRPRFVGGAANNLIVEAAKSLLPNLATTTPSSTGASHESPNLPDLEIPSFVRGKIWPPLPYIPAPESLSRPPQYVSDLLVSLYFDKLHYIFPILIKPHFMNRYQKLLRAGTDSSSPKRGRFLMVFFAVCACASGLLPTNLESGLPGIDFYQKALLILSASTGESSIEKVQCLGLLSMCSAGWNTLSQSWNLAGQAVRAAIDMGLHINGHSVRLPFRLFVGSLLMGKNAVANQQSSLHIESRDLSLQEQSRRVWWCVYTLDRTTSICLGRPLAVKDEDCYCELPLDVCDEDVMSGIKSGHAVGEEATTSPMSGFLAFAKLCQLAGKIQDFSSPLKLQKVASADAEKTHRFLARVDAHDQALRKWLESLPGEIQFSANRKNKSHGDISMVHCVITFFLHAGSLISLYRYFLNYPKDSAERDEVDVSGAIDQCINAARGCIYVADMVRDLVPASHHLAICIHYLTLSGIIL
ncbi:Zn(II)2Cys6 transcription factor [Colletotrichum scovillei]|uniref:Zn(II)2Cys6 transcription factor n=1 Tax=Colletotrichum scovillei TaxID=1209932 RepID=A0A9P7R2B3_9PEZI|nr:Zn(II)2Cys6 transcription factor [Colletotrichum scovillei]KAG7067998.1 Zn(II)2Cys6 transcription factor [Colletotrichum scovillei]